MDKEQFQEEIESFVRLYCREYAKGDPVYIIEFFDPEDPTAAEASVTITTFDGRTWEVPIGVCSTRNGEGEVVIAPDCTYLELSGDGLYAYLWNEAANRLKDAENKIERLERRIAKLEGNTTRQKQELDAISYPDLQEGDKVFWRDPDNGFSSGYGTVVGVDHPEVVSLKMESGSEVEALAHEIVKARPSLLVVWHDIEPEMTGPFSSEESRLEAARDIRSKDPEKRHGIYCLEAEGHVEVDSFAGVALDEE